MINLLAIRILFICRNVAMKHRIDLINNLFDKSLTFYYCIVNHLLFIKPEIARQEII